MLNLRNPFTSMLMEIKQKSYYAVFPMVKYKFGGKTTISKAVFRLPWGV